MNHYQDKQAPVPYLGKDEVYRPSEGLQAALNVALELNMPLLLTGEPGTGKTRFAYHVAQHFGLGEAIRFDAKTTSSATDLFYYYDALRHFHLVHNAGDKKTEVDLVESGIIRFQALGEAAMRAKTGQRSVVLIDEIDKAPRDFPNDLLRTLEGSEISFKVPELNESFQVSAEHKPIIILTSNSEKSLPEPFLRRCIFYHIPFPTPEILLDIVSEKLKERGDDSAFSGDALVNVISHFMEARTLLKKRSVKLPATAELISWLVVLAKLDLGTIDLKGLSVEQKNIFAPTLSVLAKSQEALKALRTHFGLS